jgi:hypothetical protein
MFGWPEKKHGTVRRCSQSVAVIRTIWQCFDFVSSQIIYVNNN